MYCHKNKICLRKLGKSDLPKLLRLKQESWFGTHTIAFINSDDQQKWFDSLGSNCMYFIASYDKGYNTVPDDVGIYKITDIDWISRRYNSAHDVFSEHRGQGFGYKVLEAGVDFGFEMLNMHRLDTEVLENNKASIKTALAAGYVLEGTRRKAIFKCGDWLDSYTYGLLREEWEKLPRVKQYGGCCNKGYTPKDGKWEIA